MDQSKVVRRSMKPPLRRLRCARRSNGCSADSRTAKPEPRCREPSGHHRAAGTCGAGADSSRCYCVGSSSRASESQPRSSSTVAVSGAIRARRTRRSASSTVRASRMTFHRGELVTNALEMREKAGGGSHVAYLAIPARRACSVQLLRKNGSERVASKQLRIRTRRHDFLATHSCSCDHSVRRHRRRYREHVAAFRLLDGTG